MSIHVSYCRLKLTLLMKDVFNGEPQSQSRRDAMIGHLEDLQRPRIAAARRHPAAVGAHRRIPLQMSSGAPIQPSRHRSTSVPSAGSSMAVSNLSVINFFNVPLLVQHYT